LDWRDASLFLSRGKILQIFFKSNSMGIMLQTFFWDFYK